jgi:sortase (surface protein transpeptidase)
VRNVIHGLVMSLTLAFVVGGGAPAHAATRHHGWRLDVPAIGVSAPVVTLGGHRSGLLNVPSLGSAWDVGWYRFSAVPGHRGNVVLVGHVDTHAGPAVFYNLYELRRGDRIYITTGPGHHAVRYVVRWAREVSKRRFPSRLVFRHTRVPRLWLITCGGAFDYATRSYEDNIIVSATR